jgi:F-type H+-transporting ATPase subunit epsilon
MVFEGDVDIVVLPGTEGEMGVLPLHSPVLTTLKFGLIKIRTKTEEHVFTVAGGVAEVQPKIVTILADAAENVQDIDTARAEAAKKRAEEALANVQPEDVDAYLALESALRRSNLSLEAAKRYRSGKRSSYTEE